MKGGAKDPVHSSGQQDWQTPQLLNRKILRLMGFEDFSLDPCTTDKNPVGALEFYTPRENGLHQPWKTGRTGLQLIHFNPPYAHKQAYKWVRKAFEESRDPDVVVIGILPMRTPPWFMEYVLPYVKITAHVDELSRWTELRPGDVGLFIWPGRVNFIDPVIGGPTKNSAPFDTVLVIWR